MGKKKSNAANAARVLESKVSPILEINYPDPLFSVAAHPTRPIIAQGLATGHVFCTSYDAEQLEEYQTANRATHTKQQTEAFKTGKTSAIISSVSQSKQKWWTVVDDATDINNSMVKTLWKTKRHKGSCRSILFDPLPNSIGENIYTAGTDHIIKKANTETGKVSGKVEVSQHFLEEDDKMTKMCHSATNPFILAGTENGHVLVYDSSNLSKNKLMFKVDKAHDDCINHILPMPAVSAYHYLTLGSTTLSHIDIRKGIVTQSDDQEDELLAMCYASDHVNDNKNDTVLVSHGEGIITIWKNSKNHWRDQLSRIKVNKGVSLDTIVPSMNCDTDEMTNSVWCGDADGLLHRINYKMGKVQETRVHSSSFGKYGAVDEVGNLDIDYSYRLISAGMDTLKIWSDESQKSDEVNGSDSGSDSDSDSDSDDDSGSDSASFSDDTGDSDDNGESDNEDSDKIDPSDSDSEKDQSGLPKLQRKRRFDNLKPKKRLINFESHAKDLEETSSVKKPKTKQLTTKQLRNMQQHEHGIRRFDGL
ncbi:WD repeat-containing protein JIP5 [Yamadazyma tenuis ATCC 10573]|uniref:WD repeat-containing protein JIP5 n=1 Tax=Candida tenuis (strain ATCC 10573 / BCRC 21748 / CBS 615 / JCM 9827 / NBRC 10315 / NRRL Y-1498 / VKM Y-70) TaxID=590646 RepID=G3B8H7_CANTC|nr:WD repeat-containing protein JIP5 [Yamadazyma tenuis ATCC 10573]EGV62397.1 WD repeat-containing protein JIP5 [Yamadazyma tenuis ATCC 10573]